MKKGQPRISKSHCISLPHVFWRLHTNYYNHWNMPLHFSRYWHFEIQSSCHLLLIQKGPVFCNLWKIFPVSLVLCRSKEEKKKKKNIENICNELFRSINASVASCWLQKYFHFFLTWHIKFFLDLMVAKQHSHHSLTSDFHIISSTIDNPYSGTFTNSSEVSWPYPALNGDI